MGTRRVLRQIENLQADVTEWQARHRKKVRSLERQMTDIEFSVARAQRDARRAALQLEDIERNLLRRIEQVEQRIEIHLLIRQGRIPIEDLPFDQHQRLRQGAGVHDDELLHSAGESDVEQS